MKDLIHFLNHRNKRVVLLIGYTVIIASFIIEALLPVGVSMKVAYIPPIMLISWFVSQKQGIIASIICSVYIPIRHWPQMQDELYLVFYNMASILLVFLVVTLTLSKLRDIAQEMERELKSSQYRITINALLETTFSALQLERQLEVALEIITSIPWLAVEDKGSIFIFDKNEQVLRMTASKNMPDLWLLCSKVKVGECLCGRAAKLNRMVFSNHVDNDHTIQFDNIKPHGHYCVPIVKENELLGILNLYVADGHIGNKDEENFLSVVSSIIANLINFRKTEQERNELALELKRQAQTDFLSDLHNRRYFVELVGFELSRLERYHSVMSVLAFDIDYFKNVNDTYGHQAGDVVIRRVADIAKRIVRDIDHVGRMGGEEFAILLPETSSNEALVVAERLRRAIGETEITFDSSDTIIRITISIGVASLSHHECCSTDDLMNRADKALYHAKNAGRNQVCVYRGGMGYLAGST